MKRQAAMFGWLLAFGGDNRIVSSGSWQHQQRSSKGQGFLMEREADIFVHSIADIGSHQRKAGRPINS